MKWRFEGRGSPVKLAGTVLPFDMKRRALNFPLLLRLLGTICPIGGSMLASLPFAFPLFASRTDLEPSKSFETQGAIALIESFLICMVTGSLLRWIGRRHRGGQLFQKEAMAIVGLSWVMATVLGALPYYLSGTCTSADQPITFVEAMFESQSGFSTTGATVLPNVESPELVPNCILPAPGHIFWAVWELSFCLRRFWVKVLRASDDECRDARPNQGWQLPRMQNTALVFASI